jgi:hypothetical protein
VRPGPHWLPVLLSTLALATVVGRVAADLAAFDTELAADL